MNASASIAPNAQLEAALVQFAGQPGITADQAAQLRNALIQDAALLPQYNQLAADGHLTGFGLPHGTNPNLIGSYHKASGTITLPASALQPSGTLPDPELPATLRIQEMSARYAHGTWTDVAGTRHPTTQDMVDNLQALMNGSPELAGQLRQATVPPGPGQDAPVRNFDSLPNGANAGGTYNPVTGTISLPPGVLNQPPAQFQQNSHAVTDLTFVLGHEVQHGLNATGKQAARTAFLDQIAQIAQHGGPGYDYTDAIGGYQQAARHDEARAHIAGWNALLSREQQANPVANLPEMFTLANRQVNPGTHRVRDFVMRDPNNPQQVIARPGFSFEPDGRLTATPANVEQMAQNYFDKPPNASRIGHHGDSDYPNYYGAHAVTAVVVNHRHYATQPDGTVPAIRIDLAQLGLREDLLERNGIGFPSGTTPGTRQPYVDTGQTPHAPGHLDYTRTPAGTPNSHQHVPVTPSEAFGRGAQAPSRDRTVGGTDSVASPYTNLSGFLDRMLAAAESGDDRTFREMTRTLAERPAGQALRAEAREAVDRQEQQVQWDAGQQAFEREQAAPVLQR